MEEKQIKDLEQLESAKNKEIEKIINEKNKAHRTQITVLAESH